jgi:hypothetical protein
MFLNLFFSLLPPINPSPLLGPLTAAQALHLITNFSREESFSFYSMVPHFLHLGFASVLAVLATILMSAFCVADRPNPLNSLTVPLASIQDVLISLILAAKRTSI